MQVDGRDRDNIAVLNGIDSPDVMSKDGNEFYKGDTDDVVQNYATAKYVVSKWIEANGVDQLLLHLTNGETDSLEVM